MIKGNPFGTEQNGDDDYYMRWKELRLEKCEWAKWAILCCCGCRRVKTLQDSH